MAIFRRAPKNQLQPTILECSSINSVQHSRFYNSVSFGAIINTNTQFTETKIAPLRMRSAMLQKVLVWWSSGIPYHTFVAFITMLDTFRYYIPLFPECLARVQISLWGSGGEAVFAKNCVCVRSRSQLFAYPPKVRLSSMANTSGMVSKVSRVKLTCGIAVMLAFADEVSVWVTRRAAIILALAEVRVSCKSV